MEDASWGQKSPSSDRFALVERFFRRLYKFNNKAGEWKEWRTHSLTAVKENDGKFAANIEICEKSELPIDADHPEYRKLTEENLRLSSI